MRRIDLHTHSNISDGTLSPADVIAAAVEADLDVVALTDHDTLDGLPEARKAARHYGVEFLGGLEVSTEHEGVSVHLLGYGVRPDDADLARELAKVREGRSGRIPAMAALLSKFGMPLDAQDVLKQAGGAPSVGRPHVADAMVARGYVADRREAFDCWLDEGKPAYVGRYTPSIERGIELIRGAGGVPVLAHPWGRHSRDALSINYLEQLIYCGLEGLEVDHTDHDEATRAELRAFGAAMNLIMTGSSDFHGAGKPDNPLGCNLTAPEVYDELVGRIEARGGVR